MKIVNNRILDNEGRTLILRGANLGGGSKNPFGPPGWGMQAQSLKNPAEASFVGRPFPLDEAETHLRRLSRAGFTFLRWVVTWEALEHSGPGQYDEAFLAYLRKVLLIAEKEGVSVFIDPHQDVWSRWTGGDGAPAWTLEMLGMDIDKLDESAAAITRQRYGEFNQGAFPLMAWPSNYNRYAAATMFSLFFGGKAYAPGVMIDGENVQDWLQGRYIAAFRHCHRRLKNCAAICGWGVINEPHYGFIGYKDIERAQDPMVTVGPRPSPWDAMRAASGYTVKVPVYSAISMAKLSFKNITFNPKGVSLFKEGASCVWKQAGVWDDAGGEPRLLRKDHFTMYQGRRAYFLEDFYKPFACKYIEKMKEADEHIFFFVEGLPPGANKAAHPSWGADDPPNAINAFHWYDGLALFSKSFSPWFTLNHQNLHFIFGRKNVREYFCKCLAESVDWAKQKMGNMPSLLGEFGLAFDINKRKAFANGDYSTHEEALSAYYDAVDANLLHSTIWNYTADNTNEFGDGWNDEDLSIFSEGKERAAAGWKRPYPMATAGEPLVIQWDSRQGVFRCRFIADSGIAAPTVIYLPADQFGAEPLVELHFKGDASGSVGPCWAYQSEQQRLLVFNEGYSGELEVVAAIYGNAPY